MAPNDSCRTSRINALYKIETAAGMGTGSLLYLEKDPRGSPYIFDENDGEYDCYAFDTLQSAGPDKSSN